MVAACNISREINNFSATDETRVSALLKTYQLPVELNFTDDKVWDVLLMDKKKSGDTMNFILLNKIGSAIVKSIPLVQLQELFKHATL